MAEQSLFWQTNGTGHGPAGGYSQQRLYDWMRKVLITDAEASEGVLANVGGELVVTGSSSPLSCADGAGIGYGFFFENTSSKNLTVVTPSIGTTGGRVNIRVDWTAQTATVVALRSADGTPAFPALVQSAGSTWDVPLYTFSITTGGAITLTDVRSFCHFSTKVATSMIDDLAVTAIKLAADAVETAKIANLAVTLGKIANDAVDNTKIRNSGALSVIGRSVNSTGDPADISATVDGQVLRRSGTGLGFGEVATAGIADLAVTLGKLAADSVDDTKAGNRVPQFIRRKGGDASSWLVYGTTNYTPTTVRMQAGVFEVTITAGNLEGDVTVTFPLAFSNLPIILATIVPDTAMMPWGINELGTAFVVSASASNARIGVHRQFSTSTLSYHVAWLAIGPE